MTAASFAGPAHGIVAIQPVRALPLQGDLREGFGNPLFFRPYFFGAGFPWGLGYDGAASQSDRLPLGFGLWPACDSANTPGVFWTVGPCFGIGDYSQELSASNEYAAAAPPSTYLLPLFFGETQTESGESTQRSAGETAPPPTMLLYKTDGSTIAASDWWVAQGRLQYITEAGVTGSMDLSQLDLEQTIKQNETRGLRFHLRFTPPSGEFPPSIRP